MAFKEEETPEQFTGITGILRARRAWIAETDGTKAKWATAMGVTARTAERWQAYLTGSGSQARKPPDDVRRRAQNLLRRARLRRWRAQTGTPLLLRFVVWFYDDGEYVRDPQQTSVTLPGDDPLWDAVGRKSVKQVTATLTLLALEEYMEGVDVRELVDLDKLRADELTVEEL